MNIKELGQKEITNVSGGMDLADTAEYIGVFAAGMGTVLLAQTGRGRRATGALGAVASGGLRYILLGINKGLGLIPGVDTSKTDVGGSWFSWLFGPNKQA